MKCSSSRLLKKNSYKVPILTYGYIIKRSDQTYLIELDNLLQLACCPRSSRTGVNITFF